MKKLIGLFAISLITCNVFAQINFGNWSSIQTTDTKNNTVEDHIRHGDGYNWIPDIHLIREKFIYMLAYEPISSIGCYKNTTRVVNLYCKDTTNVTNPWVIVCDSVFVSRYTTWNDYQDVDFFEYDSLRHNTSRSVIVMNRANLVISLDVHTMNGNCMSVTRESIILKRKDGDKLPNTMLFYNTLK